MAKVFYASERFREERKADAPEKLKPVDLTTLKHYHPKTGKLDLKDTSIINDAGTIQRLVDNKLILPDGTLTPAVLKKFAQIDSDINKLQPDPQDRNDTRKKESKAKEPVARPGKLTTADWANLMKYDRETGNLLQYDPEDGRPDRRSRDILRYPATVKPLIDNNMILPGGWLTPEAKKQCEKLELKIRKRQIERSTRSNKRFKANAPEKLKPVDLATLKHYHPKTGKLNLKDSSIINDAGTIQRLVDNKLILPDGTLTPAVLKKFAQIDSDINKLQPDPQDRNDTRKKESKAKEPVARPGKLTTADWANLMKYDRETGNLLQYDPEGGQLDCRSRDILRYPGTVQSLIDNNMILPGGWLTPEAKKQCEKLELKIRKRQIERSTRSNKRFKANAPEKLKPVDLATLKHYHPKTGKLNLKDSSIINDAGTIQRLVDNKLILPDGTLTPAVLKKFAQINSDKKKLQPNFQNTQKTKKKQRKAKESAVRPRKLTTADWAILMKYDRKTGNLNLKDTSIVNDAGTIKRLLDNKLILPDGTLTPAVLKKFAQIGSDINKLQPVPRDKNVTKKKESKAKEPAIGPGKLTTADWTILMKYDRETGNLLHYNPEDGRPDRRSRDILRNPETVQSLIDNNMILPGGWLTPEAKKQCEKLELKIRKRQIERSTRSNKRTNKDARRQRSESYEVMKHMDLSALSKYDREINRSKKTKTSEDAAASLRDILHIVFKRKVQILISFFAVVITTAIGTFLAKPVYEVSAQILVKVGRESVFVPAGGDMRPIINFNREERINSEIEILKSSSLAEKVVLAMGPTVLYESLKEQKPGIFDRIKANLLPENGKKLTPDERKALKLKIATSIFQDSLTIESVKKSNIVQITFEHPEPRLVAMAVNNLADIYLDHHLEVHKTPQSYKFFQEQTALLKNKLEQSEVDLKVLKKQYNITSLEQERTLMLTQLSDLRSDLNGTSSQIVETEKRISQLKRQLGITPRTIAQGEEMDLNQDVINTLQTRLVELELQEKDLSAKYTDGSRLVQNIKKEIQMVRNKLAEQEKKQYGRKRTGTNPTYQRLQEDFYRNEAELSAFKAKASAQNAQIASYQAKLEEFNKIETKLNQLKQQVEVDRENYRLYLSKYEESRISNAMDTEKISSVSLLEPARQPMKPVKPKKLLNLLLAVVVGAFGGIVLALIMEYLDDKLEKVEDVEECLQLPVLASIPELKPKERAKKRSGKSYKNRGQKRIGKIIHNALTKYSNGYHQRQVEVETIYGTLAKTRLPVPNVTKTDLEWYEDIKTKIVTHYPGESIKSIMFTGTKHGGGVTATAINFAKTLVSEKNLKVLLMDVNLRTPHFRDFFNINHDRGISELIMDGDTKVFKILKVGHSQLYIVATGSNNVRPVDLFRSEQFNRFLKKVHTFFDYVILDAAPIPSFAESWVLCEKVDGVVLVVESGDVRKQLALRAKKELEEAGARTLGVVLNKRKYPIPRWIYNRL